MINKLLKLASETIDGCFEKKFISRTFDCELAEEKIGKILIKITTDIETGETISKECEFDIDFFDFYSNEDKKNTQMQEQFTKCILCLCNSVQEEVYIKESWTKIELKEADTIFVKGAVTFKDNFIIIPPDISIGQNLRYINTNIVYDVTIL